VLAFQRDLEEFAKLDAVVIGVSKDSMEDNRKFAAENGITFPLVSDKEKQIRKRYGRGRVTYLIDRSGTIRLVKKGFPDNQAFLTELKKLD
jgi:peroxiredoxin Q/BCP